MIRVAAIQLTSTPDKVENLATAGELVSDAAERGAQLVVLPELFNCLGRREHLLEGAEQLDGPTVRWASHLASSHNLWLVAGSIPEWRSSGRLSNTSLLLSPAGEVVATYRKVHLFDNDIPGAELRESDTFVAGDRLVTSDSPPVQIGMAICFDLRFPEQFRAMALAGSRVIVVPSAFTWKTGPPHWEILLRARAIENQVFIIAADQVGTSTEGLHWHGHSMIVDPWGLILAEVEDPSPGVAIADLDLGRIEEVRRQLPTIANLRPDVYGRF